MQRSNTESLIDIYKPSLLPIGIVCFAMTVATVIAIILIWLDLVPVPEDKKIYATVAIVVVQAIIEATVFFIFVSSDRTSKFDRSTHELLIFDNRLSLRPRLKVHASKINRFELRTKTRHKELWVIVSEGAEYLYRSRITEKLLEVNRQLSTITGKSIIDIQ